MEIKLSDIKGTLKIVDDNNRCILRFDGEYWMEYTKYDKMGNKVLYLNPLYYQEWTTKIRKDENVFKTCEELMFNSGKCAVVEWVENPDGQVIEFYNNTFNIIDAEVEENIKKSSEKFDNGETIGADVESEKDIIVNTLKAAIDKELNYDK